MSARLRHEPDSLCVRFDAFSNRGILSVSHYDFNWQLGYDVAEPIHIPKGTKLIGRAHFDNSLNNKFNPDPSRTVYYGNQSWEEMMQPWFTVIMDKKVSCSH